jgi:rod shape-determining protein MreD
MNFTLWQRLDRMGRNLAPFAVSVMLVLLALIPLRIPGFTTITPPLVITSIYYWSIHRPDLMRPLVVFGIGLLQDFLTGAPLGLNAGLFLCVHGVVVTQRRLFLAGPFSMMWVGFSVVIFGGLVLQWLAYSLLSATPMRISAALIQTLLTVALFPLMAAVFIRIHRAFLQG